MISSRYLVTFILFCFIQVYWMSLYDTQEHLSGKIKCYTVRGVKQACYASHKINKQKVSLWSFRYTLLYLLWKKNNNLSNMWKHENCNFYVFRWRMNFNAIHMQIRPFFFTHTYVAYSYMTDCPYSRAHVPVMTKHFEHKFCNNVNLITHKISFRIKYSRLFFAFNTKQEIN